jgi:hypothetical protein
VLERYLTWSNQGEAYEDDYRPEHRDVVLALADRTDGPESAKLVEFWLDRQPEAFHVQRRTETGEVIAFSAWLRLTEPEPGDPVAAAAWAHGSVRPGEHIAISRFTVDPAANGRTSPAVDLMLTRVVAEWLRADRIAWSFLLVADEEFWGPQMAVVEHERVEMDTEVVSGHLPAAVDHAVVLSRPDFDAAVRTALRDQGRDDRLGANVLTRTRLADEPARLRALLVEAVEALADNDKHHRAVHTTYFRRVPTQEAAAERLGLPFSTYRRHLAAGTARVCDWLWERELGSE